MHPGEIALLRTKLRQVNIEYSALVRKKAGERRPVRMGELRVERRALMTLIAEARGRETRERLRVPSGQAPLNAAIPHALAQGSPQHA
jgi:hypothetical protein